MDSDAATRIRHDEIYSILLQIQSGIQHVENGNEAISRLMEARIEHSVEIRHLSDEMRQVLDEIRNIEGRMGKIEGILETMVEKNKSASHGFLEFMRDYWHLIAITASAISFALSFFFGIHVKE